MPSQEAGEKLEGPMASDPSTYPIDLVAVLLQEHEDILQRRKLLGLFKGAPDAVEGEKAAGRMPASMTSKAMGRSMEETSSKTGLRTVSLLPEPASKEKVASGKARRAAPRRMAPSGRSSGPPLQYFRVTPRYPGAALKSLSVTLK